jgi:hypothetical protein
LESRITFNFFCSGLNVIFSHSTSAPKTAALPFSPSSLKVNLNLLVFKTLIKKPLASALL